MTISIQDLWEQTTGYDSRNSHVDFSISVSTGDRAIICVVARDDQASGITDIDVEHDTLVNKMTMTRVATHSRSVSGGGTLRTEIWISSENTGFGGTKAFDIDIIPGTTQCRIVVLGISVRGLHSDDSMVFDTSVMKNDTDNTLDTTNINPTQVPDSLLLALFAWNERDNNPTTSPTNGFIAQIYSDTDGTDTITNHAYGYLATKITPDTLNCTIGVNSSTDYTALMAAFVGAIQYDKAHTSDLYSILIANKDHDTDTLLRKTSYNQHVTDVLLVDTSSQFHSADFFLKKTLIIQHTADMFIKPPSRSPILRNLLISNIPGGFNVGNFPVKILGMHGNSESVKQFTYALPSQEFVVSKSLIAQLNIIDPIVKKEP